MRKKYRINNEASRVEYRGIDDFSLFISFGFFFVSCTGLPGH
jgi:hypothetical protein